MQNILPVLCFIAGAALAWLAARYRRAAETAVLGERLAGREQQLRDAEAAGAARETHLAELRDRNLALAAREAELAARLETERTSAAGKLALLEDAQANLADAFRALSGEALRSNNQAFLD